MISVGSRRDAREEIGLGFVSRGREMEDTELEEGEACSFDDYHNTKKKDFDGGCDDSSIDPDTDLSYIDDKIQVVLGHFQKDFEGGVSAENLGAKFGGYGSFLPTYQRSPVWSHPRSPPKPHHQNARKSPNCVQFEGGQRNSASSSTASRPSRIGSAGSHLVSKASSSVIDPVKQEVPTTHSSEEVALPINRKNLNLPDQKMLKFRIRVGTDNLPTRKNAALYSGLGLEVSPSSSLDGSRSGSEEILHENILESPSLILSMMTSPPVHGGQLLSPLSDDLIQLTEKEKLPKDSRVLAASRLGRESSDSALNAYESVKSVSKISREKKLSAIEKNGVLVKSKGKSSKDSCNRIDSVSKEADLESLAYEELVSNTLKLPLLSTVNESVKGLGKASNTSKEVLKRVGKERGMCDFIKEEQLAPMLSKDGGHNENARSTSTAKADEDKKDVFYSRASVKTRDDLHRKKEKPYESIKTESNLSRGSTPLNGELAHAPKQKTSQKATLNEQEGMDLPPLKDDSSSEGKDKRKGNRNHQNPNDKSKVGAPSVPKIKKSSHADDYTVKDESKDLKSQNNTEKASDRYREFFGDIEIEKEDNVTSPTKFVHENKLEDIHVTERSSLGTREKLKERLNGKKSEKVPTWETHSAAPSAVAPLYGNAPTSDIAPSVAENWVCCDKCQQWRLLPLGKNPNDLPEKWLCSMLNWLPGMNRCSFTEEETTNALRALYHVPPPESQTNLQSYPGGVASTAILADNTYPDKLKEKHKALDNGSDRGDVKRHKAKVKAESDQDNRRASKKMKVEDSQQDSMSDHGGNTKRPGSSLSSGLPGASSGRNQPKYEDHYSSMDSKYNRKDRKQDSTGMPKPELQVPLDEGSMRNSVNFTKKRKLKESKDAHPDSIPITGNHGQESGIVAKEPGENDFRKAKKARAKESGGNKGSSRTERKNGHKKNQHLKQDKGNSLSQRSMDGTVSLKRDSESLHPSLAATSSSSKVSGSHKTKATVPDNKDSPVESVSSSPMRMLKEDKFVAARSLIDKKSSTSDQHHDGERQNGGHHMVNESHPKRSGKGTSSRSKDKNRYVTSKFENGKAPDSFDRQDLSYERTLLNGESRLEEKLGAKADENENTIVDKKDTGGRLTVENGKREIQSDVGADAAKQSTSTDYGTVSGRGESLLAEGAQNGGHRQSGANGSAVIALDTDNATKAPNQTRKIDQPNRIHQNSSLNPTSNANKVTDANAPSPARRDSSNQAASNAIKEATSVKHMADRLKNAGSFGESTRLYFEAALKFLHGASLMESCGSENVKTGEMVQSIQIYSSTAKLCEFCAHEYEKLKDMATAALAYKCMEVAYMRVVYSSHARANRDRHELQMSLQMIPPGESPSSSASDIDNLNHPTTADKVPSTKGISSPQVTGGHVIAGRNRPNFVRLLSFAQDVNLAMEASRKSRSAFASTSSSTTGARSREGIPSIKAALDFTFQDVEGLLRLVRLAIEDLNR